MDFLAHLLYCIHVKYYNLNAVRPKFVRICHVHPVSCPYHGVRVCASYILIFIMEYCYISSRKCAPALIDGYAITLCCICALCLCARDCEKREERDVKQMTQKNDTVDKQRRLKHHI